MNNFYTLIVGDKSIVHNNIKLPSTGVKLVAHTWDSSHFSLDCLASSSRDQGELQIPSILVS